MLTKEETILRVAKAASVIKLVCGVGNNAAWMVVLTGYDHAKKCRRFSHGVKRKFNRCIEMFHEYERRLIYADENRMFHMSDMTPEVRKKYGDITDRQYYDFWSSIGAVAYQKTLPLLTSLWNKYRLSLVSHGVKDADHVAWVMTAMAALELSSQLYTQGIDGCVTGYQLPRRMVEYIFAQFSLSAINDMWRSAMIELAPDTSGIEMSSMEEKNIAHGLTQLLEAWTDPSLMYASTMDTVDDFGEIFRTHGEQKKALREIGEIKSETEKGL